MLPGEAQLDFESKDTGGNFSAPEASLKSLVFINATSNHAAMATGVRRLGAERRVHGVSGMAGAGKTMALIGLGHDEDIRTHFVDGVLYMSIGATATVEHVTGQLSKIMRVTGATESAASVLSSTFVADAVTKAAIWFQGKRILFVIDDIWPSSTSPEGYLPELEGLLRGSPESRIVISTRNLLISAHDGSRVDFGARDPRGPISKAIFMAHAAPDMIPSESSLAASQGILDLCSGLPIALSVAGSMVSMYMKMGLEYESACRMYLDEISSEMELYPGASFLDSAIRVSLSVLEADFEKNSGHDAVDQSVSELYISLCVLKNQQFMPLPVLALMWNTSEAKTEEICLLFCSMSLAKISTKHRIDGREECGLFIHDLHLDYCGQNAARSGNGKEWHRRLLNNHMSRVVSLKETGTEDGVDVPLGLNMLEYTPRHWWHEGIANQEYIRKHLSHHLRRAGLYLELGATLLDIRWISAQGFAGGVLALKNDFGHLQAAVDENPMSIETDDTLVPSAREAVKLIAELVVAVSSDLQSGVRVLSHLFFANLFLYSQTNAWMSQFLKRIKEVLSEPFLEPTLSFYQPLPDEFKFEIDLRSQGKRGFAYLNTDFSTCDRWCASGENNDVLVCSMENMHRLACLKGHKKNVSVVKFNSDASRVISGSFDNSIIIWDWRKRESPAVTLRGHMGPVTSLSVGLNGSKLFSGSRDGTVKVWDMVSGQLCQEFLYDVEVECVVKCPFSEIVAVGTRDGGLFCMNWVSEQRLLEHSLDDRTAISSLQFSNDGKALVCGSALGEATAWYTSDWTKAASVNVPGSLTNISFHPDGTSVLLGSSQGEIRHWIVKEKELSKYNLSMARPVNGLAFRNNGNDVIVGVTLGYARAWSGPKTTPDLDFAAYRKNLLFDFSLSADGTRVAASTHDSIIRVWNTDAGKEIAVYPAPVDGCRRLALSADGTKIALSSERGMIRLWNAEKSPEDADISFVVDDKCANCLSFSLDGIRLLVGVQDEVQIWSLETKQKLGHVPSLGRLDTSFSTDGRFIIVGDSMRTTIWDASGRELVFDTTAACMQSLSLVEAKSVIRTCGPSALRMWPSSFRTIRARGGSSQCAVNATELTVDNIFDFVTFHFREINMEFCKDFLVINHYGVLSIFKVQK